MDAKYLSKYISELILPGKPLMVLSRSMDAHSRVTLCSQSIFLLNKNKIERSCAVDLDSKRWRDDWTSSIKSNTIKDILLVKDLTNLTIGSHQDFIKRIVLHYMRNSKRSMVLTGISCPLKEIESASANVVHV